MTSTESLLFIIIIVLLIAIIGGMLFMKHRYTQLLLLIDDDLTELEDAGIEADIERLKKMDLAGESLKTFNSWKKVFDKASSERIPKMHEKMEQASELANKYDLLKARKLVKELDLELDDISSDLGKTKEIFKQLLESNRANQVQYDALIKTYHNMRKEVLAGSYDYGRAIDKIEDELSNLEQSFQSAKNLSAQGDYVEGKRVLEIINTKQTSLKDKLPKAKNVQKTLKEVFPEQLDELTSSYKNMRKEKFAIKEIDFLAEIKSIRDECESCNDFLADLKVADAETKTKEIASEIDKLYDLLTKEYKARPFIKDNQDKVLRLLSHVENNSNQLILKLEHIDQSYELNHGELDEAKKLLKEVNQMENNYDQDVQDLADGNGVYSEIKANWLKMLARINEIEAREKEIVDNVEGLYEAETIANDSLSNFKQDVALVYKRLQRRNLPGKPDSFVQMYTLVVNEIAHTSQELNQVRINMEKISEEMIQISDDVERLKKEADQIINFANLVELTMQYSNKFANNPQIQKARRMTMDLYQKSYNYKDALDTIATAVERVEPGSYQRLENSYYSDLERK